MNGRNDDGDDDDDEEGEDAVDADTVARTLMMDDEAQLAAGRKARARITADHLLDAARISLKRGLDPLLRR